MLDNGNEDDCLAIAVQTGKTDHVFSDKDVSEVAHLAGGELFFYEKSSHAAFDEEPDFKQRVLEHFAASEKLSDL